MPAGPVSGEAVASSPAHDGRRLPDGHGGQVDVAVLVDLHWHADAGGHVKAWERFAEASAGFGRDIHLTVYFLGDRERELRIAENVRYRLLRPRFGTDRFRLLAQGGGHTDLAGFHPRLAAHLAGHQVVHATGIFAFAQTALRLARRHGKPLISSIHTDVPAFTDVYTREVVETLTGDGWLGRLLLDRLRVQRIGTNAMARRRDRVLEGSRRVLASSEEDLRYWSARLAPGTVTRLRRGVDRGRFTPALRDRARLQAVHGVPDGVPLILFAGRVDETKGVMTVAHAARRLLDEGRRLHVAIAGEGADAPRIKALLDRHVTLTGVLPQPALAELMASADLFAFPSQSETVGNVVLEAKASGLAVLLSAHSRTVQCLDRPGHDGFVVDERSEAAWAAAMRRLLDDPDLRRTTGARARRAVEDGWPSWADVVAEDLLPVWRAVRSEGVWAPAGAKPAQPHARCSVSTRP